MEQSYSTEPISNRGNAYRISIVIPTRNRGARLLSCLRALAGSFPDDAEVIVVSDGGDRDTFPDLSAFEASLNLTVIHVPHGGPASARNRGLELVNAPTVAFTDDDCLPRPGWIEQIQAKVSAAPITAVGGRTINGTRDNIYAAASQLILDMGERFQRQKYGVSAFYTSNNIAFPTEPLRAMGGFNTAFKTAEDRELCRRWLQAGFQLKGAKDAIVAHSPHLSLAKYWQKYLSYGQGAERFHATSVNSQYWQILPFHLFVPALAIAEMSEQKLNRRISLAILLVVWECANLTGYLMQKLRNLGRRLGNRTFSGIKL